MYSLLGDKKQKVCVLWGGGGGGGRERERERERGEREREMNQRPATYNILRQKGEEDLS